MCGVSLSKRSSQKRVFVCDINDEKFESFPKRRQENESHIDRSIEREEEEEKAVVLIAQSTTFERPTTSVGMCDSCYFAFTSIWVALQQIYIVLKDIGKSCYSRRRRRASRSSSKTKIWLTSSLPTVLTKHTSFPFGEMQTHSERIASSSVVRIGGVKYSVWPFLSPFANVRAIRFLLVAKQINEPSGDHEKAELTSSFSFKEESCSIVPVVESTKCN